MNIVELLHQRKDAKPAQKTQISTAPLSPRSEFAEHKKSLPAETVQDIANFRIAYPQLREHVIYKIMRKHDFKKNLVDTDLKFMAEMQGNRPVDQRPPPKKQAPPKDKPQPQPQPKNPPQGEGGQASSEAKPVARQESGKDNLEVPNQRHDSGRGRDGYKQRPFNPKHRDDRGDWDNRPPRDRPQGEWSDRQTQSQGVPKHQGGPHQNGPASSQKFNQQARDPNYYQPRPQRERQGGKKAKGNWDYHSQADEYVAKQPEAKQGDDKPKDAKTPLQESIPEKALSNINEESEDQSHHRMQAGESAEKGKSSRHSPNRQGKSEYSKGKHHHQPAKPAQASNLPVQEFSQPQASLVAHPTISNVPAALDALHQASGQKHHHVPASQARVYIENGLVANGLNNLLRIFTKKEVAWFRHFLQLAHTLEPRQLKQEARNGQDKRQGVFEGKKKKPAIKNNFETEENDESTNERAKKMNYFLGAKRFESEEERLKGERERVMESRLNDNASQFKWLTQKVKALEAELESLKAANQELAENQRSVAGHNEDNVYCFVPFHFVKEAYPFNSIKVSELKSGKVYMIKKDE